MLNRDLRLAVYRAAAPGIAHGDPAVVVSQELAGVLDLEPSQVRRDIMSLGLRGKRGVGYGCVELQAAITADLKGREYDTLKTANMIVRALAGVVARKAG